MTKGKSTFTGIEYQHFKDSKIEPIEESELKTLHNYADDNPCDIDVEVIHQILVDSKHIKIFRKLIDNFIFRIDSKKMVIVIHGRSNCGKTKICDILD